MNKRIIIKNTLLIIFFMFAGWYLKGRFTPPAMMGGGAAGPAAVLVQTIQKVAQAPQKEYIGIVEPIKSVDLKPQISGYVEKVLFKEGTLVKEGDILFLIEQQRHLANFDLMQAELDKAKANLVKVQKDYSRQVSLNKQKFASEATLDSATSNLAEAKANVKQAQANLDLAKINMEYTEIKAPISGVIGKAYVTQGNYINSGGETLARIVQQSPIRVVFSISDKDYLNGLEQGLQNKAVKTMLANNKKLNETASRVFFDNEIDPQTATLGVFAEYDNIENELVAGNYVKVLVEDKMQTPIITIPISAISQDKHGAYVYVVDKDGVAHQRRIALGRVFADTQEVETGINAGEVVIIQGIQKAKDGAKVKAQEVK